MLLAYFRYVNVVILFVPAVTILPYNLLLQRRPDLTSCFLKSGLDARAAAIVMRGLKRVALSGRAVCATIHQPSTAVFNDFNSLLLLKRGGEVVFFGDLGINSSKLIEYLERYDATPRIQPGENPATWMLSAIGAGSATSIIKAFDYSGSYAQSALHIDCNKRINKIIENALDTNKVSFPTSNATSYWTQANTVLFRTLKVYYRSPHYNITRVLVSAIVALLFASVYASQRVPAKEADMNSRVNSIFIAVIFLCVNAANSALAVFEIERNMFYRHKASKMYDSSAILRAFTFAELPFIFLTATFFAVPFYFLLGFAVDAEKFFLFFAFSFLAFATFTFIGQMLVSLFRDSETAQGFGGIIISFTSLFSGILIRPQSIPVFWIFM
jgi:ABC-2 type transporter